MDVGDPDAVGVQTRRLAQGDGPAYVEAWVTSTARSTPKTSLARTQESQVSKPA